MGKSVGIDLGTTFSAVAIIDPQSGLPKIVPNQEGGKTTPSVIQFINGKPIFGSEAESAFNAGEPNCVTTFKRNMGKAETYCYIDDKEYTAEQLSALLLRHIKEEAEAVLGEPIHDAVITVPAYFYSPEREATINAAKAAGLNVKKIIDEPNAAALAYGLNNWRENANILVYDLGGGTFDVTLSRMGKNGDLTTITTQGDHYLGGRDWDNRILTLLLDKFEQETELDTHNDFAIKAIARGLAEGVKKQLSAMEVANITARLPDYGKASISVSRSEFNAATLDLVERTGALCQAIIKDAGFRIADITDVLLVGGSTRMPQVVEYLTQMFGKKPITHVNPDEAVALGAAIQATKNNDEYVKLSIQVADGVMTTDRGGLDLSTRAEAHNPVKLKLDALSLRETTAHAMGIIAVSPDGTRYINDIIIPANHVRPVKVAKAFTQHTNSQGNNDMEIFVVQGDSENPLDNQVPFRYVVSGIRHMASQRNKTLIRVQYKYDNNGVIHVEARQEQDNVNLPMRREAVPIDMSMYGLPVNLDGANTSSGSTKLMSKWNGTSLVPTSGYIRELVQKAGGSIVGDVCCRLAWFNHDDLDFHMVEPGGNKISFSEKGPSPSGGLLDVDMNAGSGSTREPVENIFYRSAATMSEGVYHLFVRQYKQRESTRVGFEVECDFLGDTISFKYAPMVHGDITVVKFRYSRVGGISIIESLPPTNVYQPDPGTGIGDELEIETWD